ncbi:MAG: hypothetical protein JEZ02_16305 [Desulfatibacillum sp.]|nr:hypothetical protein [Desulfatibacillum sp.]
MMWLVLIGASFCSLVLFSVGVYFFVAPESKREIKAVHEANDDPSEAAQRLLEIF